MSWAGIANNQTVSFNNLQDAVTTGVFTALTSIPSSSEQITKSDASTYVDIDTSYPPYAAKTSSQLVVKSDLVNGIVIYGSSFGCVVPETDILVAPDSTRKAEEFVIGDIVYTEHETTKVWGYYKIIGLERKEQPILTVLTTQGDIKCSTTHLLSKNGVYVESQELVVGDVISHINGEATITDIISEGLSTVIEFTIEDAHTYVGAGFISHNKCTLIGYSFSSDACDAGATASYLSVYYTGTLGVGTILTQNTCAIDTTKFFYYSGGYIEITYNGSDYEVQSLGPCITYTYYQVTQYLNCIQNSGLGAYIIRVPNTVGGGSWWCGDDGYQYEFYSNYFDTYYDITATSTASSCPGLPC
jgi:hypothetical protein